LGSGPAARSLRIAIRQEHVGPRAETESPLSIPRWWTPCAARPAAMPHSPAQARPAMRREASRAGVRLGLRRWWCACSVSQRGWRFWHEARRVP